MRPMTGAQETVSRSGGRRLGLRVVSQPDCIAMPQCRYRWVSRAKPWYGRIGIRPSPRGHGSMPTRGVGLRASAHRCGHLARIGCTATVRKNGADRPDVIRHSVACWWYSLARCSNCVRISAYRSMRLSQSKLRRVTRRRFC
jgi:hypothetical protein